MNLYLMQHGSAASKAEDPARPLTEDGRAAVERVAHAVAPLDLGIAVIYHSGKLRAEQTAQCFASIAAPGTPVEPIAGLDPNDDPTDIAGRKDDFAIPALLVGHLPHLDRLLAFLVVGDADRSVVAFHNAALVALRREDGAWRVHWIVSPDTVAGVK